MGEVEDVFANHADDAMAVNRALKWALVSHALVFRGRSKHRGQRRFRDNVQTRFVLWREGNYRKLLDLMMKAADKVRRRRASASCWHTVLYRTAYWTVYRIQR